MRTLHHGARRYFLRPRGSSRESFAGEVVTRPANREDAERFLARIAREPGDVAALRRLLQDLDPLVDRGRLDGVQLTEQLARMWLGGRLELSVVAEPPLAGLDGDVQEEEPDGWQPRIREERRVEKTWIEIELLDENEAPVAGERYRVRLTDGETRQGRLDRYGRARYDYLDPGPCAVWFPDLAAKAWTIEARQGDEDDARPATAPRSWVEIELLDEDGAPAAGVSYEIQLPSGDVVRGELDEYGTAFHGDIDPGTCTVTFPELNAREWEAASGRS